MRSMFDFTRPSSLISLFKSLVLPILSYVAQIWSHSTQYEQYELEKVIHRVWRFATVESGNPMPWNGKDYSRLYEHFNMLTIKQLHLRNYLCFVYKILNGSICHQFSKLFSNRTVP